MKVIIYYKYIHPNHINSVESRMFGITKCYKNWGAAPFKELVFRFCLPLPLTLHTYFYSLDSRLGDLSHLGLRDRRLVLVQRVQLKSKKQNTYSYAMHLKYYHNIENCC